MKSAEKSVHSNLFQGDDSLIEPIWISELRQSLADPNIDRHEISNHMSHMV